jgi:hypothetical protein
VLLAKSMPTTDRLGFSRSGRPQCTVVQAERARHVSVFDQYGQEMSMNVVPVRSTTAGLVRFGAARAPRPGNRDSGGEAAFRAGS